MNILTDIAIMNRSVANTETVHMQNRWLQGKKKEQRRIEIMLAYKKLKEDATAFIIKTVSSRIYHQEFFLTHKQRERF